MFSHQMAFISGMLWGSFSCQHCLTLFGLPACSHLIRSMMSMQIDAVDTLIHIVSISKLVCDAFIRIVEIHWDLHMPPSYVMPLQRLSGSRMLLLR